jgi:MFS family permease
VFWASGFGTGIWASQLPRMKALFALNDAGLSTVVLSFALGAIVTMPLIGALTTRLGGVRTVVATGVAAAATLMLLGLARSYPWLLTTALLTGVSIGGLDVAMNTQATVIERAWGAPIMSGIHAWFSLGGLSGAATGGALIALAVPYSAVFGVGAAIALIAVAIAPRWLAVAGEATGGMGFAWPRLSILGIGVLCLLAFLYEGAALDWTAVYMHDVAGASLDVAASGYAGFSLSMAVMRFAGDGFVRRFGPVRVLGAGAALAAFGIALACAWPRPWAVTAGLTLAGFGQANVVPLLFSAAGRVPGVAAGAGVAMAATMGYGAFLLGPPLIGFLADWVGLRAALLVLVASGLAIACSARTVAPRQGARRGAR